MKPETIGGFSTFPVEFGRDGNILDEGQVTALRDGLAEATDLLVLSHGWNNDEADARNHVYGKLLASMSPSRLPAGRRLVVMLVYWPSKRFADADLIPGGAAALEASGVDNAIDATIDTLKRPFSPRNPEDPEKVVVLERLRALSRSVEDDSAAQDDFVRLLRSIMPAGVNEEEDVLQDSFYAVDGETLLRALSRRFRVPTATGGATGVPQFGGQQGGGAAGALGNLFGGLKNGARNMLNLFTYYEMKERAGTVGSQGVADVIRRAQQSEALRVHLCGHSFGGRVMAAALAAHRADDAAWGVRSVVLLQAAFSHWGFAENYDGHKHGFFRRAFEGHRLVGPMLVTHTENDSAVGLAYPLASRLRHQIASGLGDANDPYGGIGRNGAQKTPETLPGQSEKSLRPTSQAYGPLQSRTIYNLEGGTFITDHGAVTGPEVAHALWAAILATP